MDIKPILLSKDKQEVLIDKFAYNVNFVEDELNIDIFRIAEIHYETMSVKIVKILPPSNDNFETEVVNWVPANKLYMNLQGIFDEMIRSLIFYRDKFVPEKLDKIKEEYIKRFKHCNLDDEVYQVKSHNESVEI